MTPQTGHGGQPLPLGVSLLCHVLRTKANASDSLCNVLTETLEGARKREREHAPNFHECAKTRDGGEGYTRVGCNEIQHSSVHDKFV